MQTIREFAVVATRQIQRYPRLALVAALALPVGIAAIRTIPHCICAARYFVARVANAPDDNINVPRPAPSQALIPD
jgi:hypothetical protein